MTSIFGSDSLFGSLGLTGSSSSNGLSTTQISTTAAKTSQSSSTSLQSQSTDESPEQKFLDYMHKPLAERIRDAWLAAHHLTEDDLKNMSPSERDSIEKQMAADLKAQMQQQAQKKTPATTNTAPGLAKLLSASM
jgi:ABC-type transporter MlaC component